MESDGPDLFNNPALKAQFDSLPEEQKKTYKDAGAYMYSKNYEDVFSGQRAIDDAVDALRRAFHAGLMPWHLSEDELRFLVGVYGENWYTEFGFDSVTKPSEKKTTKLSNEASRLKKEFSLMILRLPRKQLENPHQTELVDENTIEDAITTPSRVHQDFGKSLGIVDTSEQDDEDYDNRHSGYVYTQWC
jgi:hypothetical protein